MGKIYTFNDKIITINNKWCEEYVAPPPVDPLNPLNLPDYTIRVKFSSDYTPDMGDSQTLVDSTNNIWDIYSESDRWTLFRFNNYLLEVLGANTSEIARMDGMFNGCNQLSTVSLFDTSNVTRMDNMFRDCGNLTSIPLYNTSKAINMNNMFNGCSHVASGALALYQQASSQVNPPSSHTDTFKNCGNNSDTGRVELAQIPSSWGGTGA